MKIRNLLLILLIGLMQINLEAQTNVGGTLSSNATWTLEGSPYNLTSTLGVPTGITLTIEPGVVINYNSNYQIVIAGGNIYAVGNANSLIIFNGISAGNSMIIFKNSDLSNSTLNYLKMIGQKGIQLSDNNSDNNSDTLRIYNLILENTSIITKGYDSNAKFEIYDALINNSIIQGDYPRSEQIEVFNSQIQNSEIYSYAYNKGIFLTSTSIDNSVFASGCCGSNINLNNAIVYNCSFNQANDSQPGSHNNLNIETSKLINCDINMPISTVNIFSSIFEYNNNYSLDYCINSGNGTIDYTTFFGNGDNTAIKRGPSNYSYDNKDPYNISNSSFSNFQTYIAVNGGTSATSGDGPVTISNCNFDYQTNFMLYNNSVYDVTATNNWWGTTDTDEIEEFIFDMYDDVNMGIVDYSDYLLLPDTEAPISPPKNVFISVEENGVRVNWSQNLESDLAGYKIYYNPIDAFSYENVIDVGNVTSYTISGLNISDTVVVTAYDIDADNTDDQIQGHESWYSSPAKLYFTYNLVSGTSYCFGDQLGVEVDVIAEFESDNSFIVELSDKNGSFENEVILAQIDTTGSFEIMISIPDTLDFGTSYLIRVKSTNPEAYSEDISFTVYQIPTSTFELNAEQLCGSEIVTVSYTGNATETANYNWDFDGGNIQSGNGQGDYVVSWDTPGNKIVRLSVIENGCYSHTNSTSIPIYYPVSDFNLDEVVCENLNTIIEFIGFASDSAIFEWNFDNANIISGTGSGPYVANWDEFGIKNISLIINDNGCISTSTQKLINHNAIPTVSIDAPENICFQGVATISYSGSASESAYYNWNFDGGLVLSGSGSGPYQISWTNGGIKTIFLEVEEGGCSANENIILTVNPQTQPNPICMVTVDESSKNMIVWEVPDYNPYDSIAIYKESSQSEVYSIIGTQSVIEHTFFIDENSNPAEKSSRYKLAVIDSCGFETNLSIYHKTMHLTINAGMEGSWNLIWDRYEGFEYSTFHIYRGTSDGNLAKIAEQASNSFTFTDLYPPAGALYYQIVVVNPNPCNVALMKTSGINYSSSHSNMVNSQEAASISGIELNNIKIWPNPVSDILFIHSENLNVSNNFILSTIDGRVLLNRKIEYGISQIDLSGFTKGIYIITLSTGVDNIRSKILKQ